MIPFGILLFLAGGGSYFWAAPKLDAVRSPMGQFALALGGLAGTSARDQAEIQTYQAGYYGGMVAMALGALLVIVGAIQKSNRAGAAVQRPAA